MSKLLKIVQFLLSLEIVEILKNIDKHLKIIFSEQGKDTNDCRKLHGKNGGRNQKVKGRAYLQGFVG
jgi:hypothetical protein